MKAIITAIIIAFGINAQASQLSPDQMTPAQKAQLIEVLNQLQPEMLDSLLSEEALEWYIDQFTRESSRGESFEASIGLTDIGGDYNDPNAPVIN